MLKLISLATIQSLFLVSSQIFLKFAMKDMEKFSLTLAFIVKLAKNYYLAFSGLCMVIATMLWMYILKRFEFSVAYPLISISYIFGLIAAVYIFKEQVPTIRWIGVFVIGIGIFLITRN